MPDVLAADRSWPGATALVGELPAQTDRLTAVYLGALPVVEADGRWAGRCADLFDRTGGRTITAA